MQFKNNIVLNVFNAVLLLANVSCTYTFETSVKITIAHFSNLFSRYAQVGWDTGICHEGDECSGGYCTLSAYLNDLKKTFTNLLVLNTGNTLGGSLYWDLYQIAGCRTMTKYLGDIKAVLGSSELFLGAAVIKDFISDNKNIQYLGCNLKIPAESQLKPIENKFHKSIIQIVDGVNVGIIGFTSETVSQTASSKKEVEILEAIPCISKEAQNLYENGVKIILVFGFASFEEAVDIVSQLPLIDIVIVGGIGDDKYTFRNVDDQSKYPIEILLRSGRRSLILHSFNVGYSRYVGLLQADFNINGFLIKYDGEMVLLNSVDYKPNTNCETELKALDNTKTTQDNETSEMLKAYFVADIFSVIDMLQYDCSRMECTLGNFVADAILHYIWQGYSNVKNGDTYVSMLPAYAFTSSINRTKVTMADIQHALSMRTRTISMFTISGKDLLQVFEEVAYNVPGVQFLQVSGLHLHYDLRYKKGSRIVEAYVFLSDRKLSSFQLVQNVEEIRILTLTSLLKNGLIPTLSAKYKSEALIKKENEQPVKLEEIVYTFLAGTILFKHPTIEDRIIVDTANYLARNSKITFILCLIANYYTIK